MGNSGDYACATFTGGDSNKANNECRMSLSSKWRSCMKSSKESTKTIKIRTEKWGQENSYAIGSCLSNQKYASHKNYEEECSLAPGSYYLDCKCMVGMVDMLKLMEFNIARTLHMAIRSQSSLPGVN